MKRRDFLKAASGTAGVAVGTATAASGTALAQDGGNETSDGSGDESGSENGSGGGGGGGGGTETVELVDYAYEPGTESPLTIAPGTTVKFVWITSTHNIVVESQPEGANWEGHETIEDEGFEYEHTFETEGTYEFYCAPHKSLGMVGTIEVSEGGGGGGGGESGPVEQDPHEMGVPFQAHFVGISTILMVLVSLVYTFFVLKYGESRHTSAPNKK